MKYSHLPRTEPSIIPYDLLHIYNNHQYEKKEPSLASLTLDALAGEIERLRRMKDECGKLSRRNEQRLKHAKSLLRSKLGAAVIYPEDKQHVPKTVYASLSFALKDIDHSLKDCPGCLHDGRLFGLFCDIFGFEVAETTVARYYYMADKNRELGK